MVKTAKVYIQGCCCVFLSAFICAGTTRTWTGGAQSADWSSPANWTPSGAPENGDALVFPAGVSALLITNDLVDGRFDRVHFVDGSGGYVIRGNALTLTNGITASNSVANNSIDLPIVLARSQNFVAGVGEVLTVSGSISGSASLTKAGPGTVIFDGSADNTYLGVTHVREGSLELRKTFGRAIRGDLNIGLASGETNAARVIVPGAEPYQFYQICCRIVVNKSGLYQQDGGSQGVRSISGDGSIVLNSSTLGLGGSTAPYDPSVFSGSISGTGRIDAGRSSLTLNGDHPFSGELSAFETGRLVINGSIPNANITLTEASLEGSGTIRDLSARSVSFVRPVGTIFARSVTFTTGRYDASSGLIVASSSNVNLAPTTSLIYSPPYGSDGQSFTILEKTSPGPVLGTFRNLPEGVLFPSWGRPAVFSYAGGDGNDVTLTFTNPLSSVGVRVEGGNNNGVLDAYECTHLFISITNPTPTTVTGVVARLDSLTPEATVTHGHSTYLNIPARSARTNTTPFQLSTSRLQSGTDVKLLLTLTTISQVAFEVLFAVPIVLSNKVPALDGGGECSNCLPIVAGTLSSGSPTLPGKRLRLTGVPSGCGAPKLCPGETNQLGARRYNAHVFDNPGPEMCVSVALRVPCQGMLHASAHAYTLSPLWMCDNYRGDTGVAVAEGTGGFSFRVPAGAPFIILVNEVEPGAGCDNYTLELYGLPCPPPRLNIAHVPDLAQVRLSWSSAYLGFSLQRVASFNDPQFTDVPMVPTLIGLEYAVTNPASGTQSYFRLRKTLNE